MCICLYVKYSLFLTDFNGTGIFRYIFEKYSDIKLNENHSSGSRVPCRRTGKQRDMAKIIVALCKVAKAPKSCTFCPHCIYVLHTHTHTHTHIYIYIYMYF